MESVRLHKLCCAGGDFHEGSVAVRAVKSLIFRWSLDDAAFQFERKIKEDELGCINDMKGISDSSEFYVLKIDEMVIRRSVLFHFNHTAHSRKSMVAGYAFNVVNVSVLVHSPKRLLFLIPPRSLCTILYPK